MGEKKSDSNVDSNDSEKSTDEKLDEWLDKKSESDDVLMKRQRKKKQIKLVVTVQIIDNTTTELRALTVDNYENSVKGITDDKIIVDVMMNYLKLILKN